MWAIFDMDGTLSDDRHRIAYSPRHPDPIENKGWEEYQRHQDKDKPFEGTAAVALALKGATHRLALVTARPEIYRESTEQWLKDHGLYVFEDIHMRPHNDFRPDWEFKKGVYMKHFLNRPVLAVFEDNIKCIEMWQSINLHCFVLPGGDIR